MECVEAGKHAGNYLEREIRCGCLLYALSVLITGKYIREARSEDMWRTDKGGLVEIEIQRGEN